jgi:hypothetical protein
LVSIPHDPVELIVGFPKLEGFKKLQEYQTKKCNEDVGPFPAFGENGAKKLSGLRVYSWLVGIYPDSFLMRI